MEELRMPRPANSPPLTPLTFLERAATAYPDRPSLIHDDVVVATWPDTHRRCLRLASSLRAILGIRSGDVVSAFLPNIPAMYELQFSVPMSGAVLNNLNTRLDARSVSALLRHSRSAAIVLDSVALPLIQEALSLLPGSHPRPSVVVVQDSSARDSNGAVNHVSCFRYEDLVSQGDPDFSWVRPESEWDPMVLNYTSGTTSDPKGVVMSHRGTFMITVDSIINWPLPKGPVYLWTLPIFHANGWSYPWAMAAVGGTNVCMRRFDASNVFKAIRRHRVTHMCGAPVVLNMLANAGAGEGRLERPVEILTAGAPPPAEVLRRAEETGFVVSHGYGLTETGGLVVTCPWQDKWNHFPASERARLKSR